MQQRLSSSPIGLQTSPTTPTITFVSDGADHAVATALKAAKGKGVVLFSASIPQQCLDSRIRRERAPRRWRSFRP